ncbi:hotdog family protein [Bordetella genomosp. 13]|uniref:ApeP family dehydratase n=1 Tax=Bordetella genomosp. 13 TaxID=463040 RepID=UPI0011A7B993|nr:hotdog family protein [Bordetella genomosp. 13]
MWSVDELLPHAGNAILLDTVRHCDDDALVADAVVAPGGLYSQPDGSLPPWAGLELMAQAVAAWAGWRARQDGQPVQLGFLLGTRRYECHVPRFAAGSALAVTATRSLEDAIGMGVFECSIHQGGQLLALARLNVYRPPDAAAFMQESFPSASDVTSAP